MKRRERKENRKKEREKKKQEKTMSRSKYELTNIHREREREREILKSREWNKVGILKKIKKTFYLCGCGHVMNLIVRNEITIIEYFGLDLAIRCTPYP